MKLVNLGNRERYLAHQLMAASRGSVGADTLAISIEFGEDARIHIAVRAVTPAFQEQHDDLICEFERLTEDVPFSSHVVECEDYPNALALPGHLLFARMPEAEP